MWEYQLDALVNAGFRVITYDRRGFGCSSKPWNGYDYDTLADDLNTLLDTLDLQNATLVGFSMGGGEVARYCSRYGVARLSNVILISSILPLRKQTQENPDGVSEEQYKEKLESIENDRIDFLTGFGKDFFGVGFLSQPISDGLLDYYRMLASMASPRATKVCMNAFIHTDFSKDLQYITVPTLIIHGDDDKTVPIDITSRKLAKVMTNSQLVEYEGAPHGLFYTEKDRLNKDIISFVNDGFPASRNELEEAYVILPDNDALPMRN
jgi:pimeloyl-ACP methyl ester carboxylesterase